MDGGRVNDNWSVIEQFTTSGHECILFGLYRAGRLIGLRLMVDSGGIDVILHYHPGIFPRSPYVMEVFVDDGDVVRHITLNKYETMPSIEQFKEDALSFVANFV